jgi:putative solute:sodium symporter small subunit
MAQSSQSGRARASRATKTQLDAYWRDNLRIIGILLVIWFIVSYLPVFFVSQLNQLEILTGFPLGYYMGSQGSLIVFVVLIFYYAWYMARLDAKYGLDDD